MLDPTQPESEETATLLDRPSSPSVKRRACMMRHSERFIIMACATLFLVTTTCALLRSFGLISLVLAVIMSADAQSPQRIALSCRHNMLPYDVLRSHAAVMIVNRSLSADVSSRDSMCTLPLPVNTVRLSRFIALVNNGVGVTVGVTGGSVSAGHALEGDENMRRRTTFAAKFVAFLNENFPVNVNGTANRSYRNAPSHSVWNRARPASTSLFASLCNEHLFLEGKHQEEEHQTGQQPGIRLNCSDCDYSLHMPDLLLVDFSLNDRRLKAFSPPERNAESVIDVDLRAGPSIERLVRVTLSRNDFPTAIVGILLARRDDEIPAQEYHKPVYRLYNVPYVGTNDNIMNYPGAQRKVLDLYADVVHLNDRGHQRIADFIEHLLKLNVRHPHIHYHTQTTPDVDQDNTDQQHAIYLHSRMAWPNHYLPQHLYKSNEWMSLLRSAPDPGAYPISEFDSRRLHDVSSKDDALTVHCHRLKLPYTPRYFPYNWTALSYAQFATKFGMGVGEGWIISHHDEFKRGVQADSTEPTKMINATLIITLSKYVRTYLAVLVMTTWNMPGLANVWLSCEWSDGQNQRRIRHSKAVTVNASSPVNTLDIIVPVWARRRQANYGDEHEDIPPCLFDTMHIVLVQPQFFNVMGYIIV